MSYTAAQLRTAVAGFMQRDTTVFVRGDVDLLLVAVNNARLYAERRVDFELSKIDVVLPVVDLLNGADLSTAVLATDLTTPVRVKKIITPFIGLHGGAGPGNYPVDLWSRKKWNDRVKMRWEAARPTDTEDYAFITDAPFVVVQDGSLVFITPPDSSAFTVNPFPLWFNVVRWLDPYVDGTENDFLLDNCFDWMMFYCISQLNFFLKEDERVNLSAKMLADTWDSLVKWNNELIMSSVDDVDLD